jgi:hypothetical protein
VKTINPEVLPPESKALPQSKTPQQEKTLEDYFLEGFSSAKGSRDSFYSAQSVGNAAQSYSACSTNHQQPTTSAISDLFAIFSKISEHKGRVFFSILAAFSVLFAGSVIVARNSAELSGVRSASLATATGALGAMASTTLCYGLVAKLPGSKN